MSRESRRSYITIAAFDPDGEIEVSISIKRMKEVGSRGLGHTKEAAFIVPMVLQDPSSLFEGIRTEEDEDRSGTGVGWRCYCGLLNVAYHLDGEERGPYLDKVFLVFVNDERVAYNWRWDKCDPSSDQLPRNFKTRFRKNLR